MLVAALLLLAGLSWKQFVRPTAGAPTAQHGATDGFAFQPLDAPAAAPAAPRVAVERTIRIRPHDLVTGMPLRFESLELHSGGVSIDVVRDSVDGALMSVEGAEWRYSVPTAGGSQDFVMPLHLAPVEPDGVVRLPYHARIQGRVLAEASRRAVEGATVVATVLDLAAIRETGEYFVSIPTADPALLTDYGLLLALYSRLQDSPYSELARTDKDGSFTITLAQTGRVILQVEDDQYMPFFASFDVAPGNSIQRDALLATNPVVEGWVKWEDGAPARQIEVSVFATAPASSNAFSASGPTGIGAFLRMIPAPGAEPVATGGRDVRTDSSGFYRTTMPRATTYAAYALVGMKSALSEVTYSSTVPGTVRLDLELREQAPPRRFRLQNADGSPAVGFTVSVVPTDDPWCRSIPSVVTGPDGMVEYPILPGDPICGVMVSHEKQWGALHGEVIAPNTAIVVVPAGVFDIPTSKDQENGDH
ncbi:MAG TPA: hypothetical protein VGC54_15175 [Planctomycetota bacterium]